MSDVTVTETHLFFRDGNLIHSHRDRGVFERWMADAPERYPAERCEIVRFVPETELLRVVAERDEALREMEDAHSEETGERCRAEDERDLAVTAAAEAGLVLEGIRLAVRYELAPEILAAIDQALELVHEVIGDGAPTGQQETRAAMEAESRAYGAPAMPSGACLVCAHIHPYAVFVEAGEAHVGVCGSCYDLAKVNQGICSAERGCSCAGQAEEGS